MNKAAESVDISDKDAYKVNDMDHSKNDTKQAFIILQVAMEIKVRKWEYFWGKKQWKKLKLSDKLIKCEQQLHS